MDNLNRRNIKLTLDDIRNILLKANIKKEPNNIEKYQQAFVHKTYVKDSIRNLLDKVLLLEDSIVDLQPNSYETLEFYGDSIVSASTVEYLFNRFPSFNEGDMTKLKINIISVDYLSKFARYYGFNKFLLLGDTLENIYGRDKDSILEDTFEAFVAAISLDIDYNTAKKFVVSTIDKCVNFTELIHTNKNYKHRILNFFQISGWNFPKYEVDVQLGPPIKRTYVVKLLKNYKDNRNTWVKEEICKGIGKTKKDAEMNASYNALKMFNLLKGDE